jgi:hypothetical protein
VEILGIPTPEDFPSEPYLKVTHAFESWPDVNRKVLEQLRASWNAVGLRYLAAARWDEEFRECLNSAGPAPHGLALLDQDSALFGFFAAAVAVIDSVSYAAYAAGALARPGDFPYVRESMQRRINLDSTIAALKQKGQHSTLGFALEETAGSAEFRRICDIRNVLVHRSVPLRDLELDPGTLALQGARLQFQIHGQEPVLIEAALTAAPRDWLASRVADLCAHMLAFIEAAKGGSSEVEVEGMEARLDG